MAIIMQCLYYSFIRLFAANLHFDPKNIAELEKSIDEMTEQLPPLVNFILPASTTSTMTVGNSLCMCDVVI